MKNAVIYVSECCELFCRCLFGGLTIAFLSVGVLYVLLVILAQFGVCFLGSC